MWFRKSPQIDELNRRIEGNERPFDVIAEKILQDLASAPVPLHNLSAWGRMLAFVIRLALSFAQARSEKVNRGDDHVVTACECGWRIHR